MNSLSAGEIESFSREAFLLKTDEVLNLIALIIRRPTCTEGSRARGED
jgi:hypothetical protein